MAWFLISLGFTPDLIFYARLGVRLRSMMTEIRSIWSRILLVVACRDFLGFFSRFFDRDSFVAELRIPEILSSLEQSTWLDLFLLKVLWLDFELDFVLVRLGVLRRLEMKLIFAPIPSDPPTSSRLRDCLEAPLRIPLIWVIF